MVHYKSLILEFLEKVQFSKSLYFLIKSLIPGKISCSQKANTQKSLVPVIEKLMVPQEVPSFWRVSLVEKLIVSKSPWFLEKSSCIKKLIVLLKIPLAFGKLHAVERPLVPHKVPGSGAKFLQ